MMLAAKSSLNYQFNIYKTNPETWNPIVAE